MILRRKVGSCGVLLGLVSSALSGCAASRLMIRYGDLETKTELSQSVFLELRSDLPRTVFLSETSTSGEEITVLPDLPRYLAEAGYALVPSQEDATYILQINHRQLVEYELSEGMTVSDAVVASLAAGSSATYAASLFGASGKLLGGVGLAAGLIGFAADASTKHIAHTLTTDVLITETLPALGENTGPRYQETQVVTGASKVNLQLEESLPVLIENMSASLGRIFPPASG